MDAKQLFYKIANKLIPEFYNRKILSEHNNYLRLNKKKCEEKIPKVALEKKHMQNCQLLLNRNELLLKLKNNGIIAELGVAEGDFSKEIFHVTQPELLHLVDSYGSDRYSETLLKKVEQIFEKAIKNNKIKIHRADSISEAQHFPNNYFDWIYIDTDHSYETTKRELNAYQNKIKSDGIIAGHDYSMGNWVKSYRYGVIEAVHEFCVKNDWELIYLTLEPTERQSFAIRRIQQ